MQIIIHHLYQVLRAEEEIQFHNTYCGVPIGYSGKIVEIGKQTVRFQTHAHQLFCMKKEEITHIESNLLPGVVRAAVLNVDMKSRHAMLGNFTFTTPDYNPYEDVRVEPPEPLPISLWVEEERHFPAKLDAISIHNLTLHLHPEGQPTETMHSGEMIRVRFGFAPAPNRKTIIKLEGRIRNIQPLEKGETVDVQIFPDTDQQDLLARYIARRQKEILTYIHTQANQALERV